MSTVKTYQGHEVPEGATHYGPEVEGWFECFYKFDFAETSTCLAGESKWVEASTIFTRTDILELPQEPETFAPVVGEWYAHVDGALWCKHGDLFYIGNDKAGFKVMQSESGSLLKFGDSAIFQPVKTERDNIKMWVESKIDCLEDFQLDMAIMITKMLDLGCLVIPDSDKC